MNERFQWPLCCIPNVLNAGKFPFSGQHFANNYLAIKHHALHFYDYHGVIRLCGNDYPITPGSCSITPMGKSAQYHLEKKGFHYCVHFNVQERFESGGEMVELPLFFNLGLYMDAAIFKIIEISRLLIQSRGDRLAAALMSHQFQTLMIWLASIENMKKRVSSEHVNPGIERVTQIIERNLDKNISIPELSSMTGLTQNYLAKIFRQNYGMTINQYILERRVEYARTLLSISDLSIKEIGGKVGIPDPQYFNKQFRGIVGISPLKYRLSSS